ncbi:3D-(3,5/4)-trihydroxycyclohexane-1,2-dione acylhydrolase (decyclizing) [Mumia sp. zg.B53]|uniref:3D-(3,5/4)-trihydroxycyclohexane-1,2-dione acylhydrolase (decyclizing) n=1 Tax=Mumia sp. zg.B53 TaxID=2855449 RepID=UPI001C6E9C79|nr:3D-(3,5/4)-trihydroxycyclohexane-1,2-dione acylhydrolase (decyclizing) [Mumia sp. zg.B53]MBW9216609.1 3D-(3,5/4)-trihydroxycyclohexane-1,2-dione acylhydrolase (decyclizing) [Mumia sp. zg.B53]
MTTTRLTVAQAVVRFLEVQHVERDGAENAFFAGCWGIFGHGNVAGIGEALLERELSDDPGRLRYLQGRNEQAMVHASVAYARQRDRLAAFAVTASVGPGSTNMVTGAALATINRLPVLLLPGDVFATRVANPVLQELEDPASMTASVNDALRPVSRYWDRIERPEQLPSALLAAMRVLTDPADTGAVTLCLPQDVQAEAYDWPEALFDRRVWHVARPVPEAAAVERAAALVRSARRPLLVAGGGVIYSGADGALRRFAEATGIPVAETQAGKGSLPYDHPQAVGAIGATGSDAADALANEADVVIGVGTRWSDFTTASRTVFARPEVRFVNLNVASVDAHKQSGLALVADARAGLEALGVALEGWRAPAEHTSEATERARAWDAVVEAAYAVENEPLLAQSAVIGAVNDGTDPRDVVVCAAGSMPGDLHKLWRTRDRKGYHVEYGFSCMGYEIAGGLGVKLAADDTGDPRDVVVMVGDGSYLMMGTELVTAVAEDVKIIVVLVQNHGFASIGALSESLGSQRFGTRYRYRTPTGLDGERLPVDLAANAASLGADVIVAKGLDDLRAALRSAKASERTTVIHVETDPLVPAPDSPAWWDVPVSEVSTLDTTRAARTTYEQHKAAQRHHLGTITEQQGDRQS